MKSVLLVAFCSLVFVSCGNNENTNTRNNDSTNYVSPTGNSMDSTTQATGTTGTGTVSDSENAATHPNGSLKDSTQY